MKRAVTLLITVFMAVAFLSGAPLSFEPVTKTLPDGTVLALFLSGDEFFNYLHDASGYPVGQGADGYYYYLTQESGRFDLTPWRAGEADPGAHHEIRLVTVPSWVKEKREKSALLMKKYGSTAGGSPAVKASGRLNNLIIYIRFKDEPDFAVSRSAYETKFNSLTDNSMRHYFREVSYDKLDIISYHFPGGPEEDIWYTDNFARNYYRPYNVLSNTDGYRNDDERISREHSLLAKAVGWASANYTLPKDINFDINHDGRFDNVSFIIRGSADGWSELLWPHRWILFSEEVKIGDLIVNDYTVQLENVSVNTLAHEMFHSMGAPDLYHYDNTDIPVGPWDIMASGKGHPGAWMKYKYGGWIEKIPEIKHSGTYALRPLTEEGGNSFIIRSPYDPEQFIIVEYRVKSGTYESALPSSGMIIQRIDTRYKGNARGAPDEIYIFRKNGTLVYNGAINEAPFSDLNGVTSFNDLTNPFSFLQDGSRAGIRIADIVSIGDSLLFTVDLDNPVGLALKPVSDNAMDISWKSLSPTQFILAVSEDRHPVTPVTGKAYYPGDTLGPLATVIYRGPAKWFRHYGLMSDKLYFYSVWAVTDSDSNSYSMPDAGEMRSGIYTVQGLPYVQNFDDIVSGLPRGWSSSLGEKGWSLNVPVSGPGYGYEVIAGSDISGNWLYTPGFYLTKGKKYLISFSYRNRDYGISETLEFRGGTDRNNGGLNSFNLMSEKNINFHDMVLHKSVVQPDVSSNYYFGFKTGYYGKGVVIDNFMVEKAPQETKTHSGPGEFYPNPTSGMITVPATGKTGISVFRSDGIRIFETEIEAMKEIDLSSLGSGAYVIQFITLQGTSAHILVIQ